MGRPTQMAASENLFEPSMVTLYNVGLVTAVVCLLQSYMTDAQHARHNVAFWCRLEPPCQHKSSTTCMKAPFNGFMVDHLVISYMQGVDTRSQHGC